jgi:hypothetical protein
MKEATMAEQTWQVLYHKCGATVVQDVDGTFKVHGGDMAGESILMCPICGAVLRDRDLYHAKSDIAREKLHDAGWYPDPDGLALMDDPARRAVIVATLREAFEDMSDADLLSVYAVVLALTGEGEQ